MHPATPLGPGKRLVVEVDGIDVICGHFAPNEEIPVLIMLPVNDDGPPKAVNLIKVRPRFALFREIMEPATGQFNDFNPRQV